MTKSSKLPTSETAFYRAGNPHIDIPQMERDILAVWRENGVFERSVEGRPSRNEADQSQEYIFYDGPPFANGLPHHGHLLTGYIKDLIPRYQTMKGKRVDRRFGWDCHGLPAEMETEKELKLSGRKDIMRYGVAEFNKACATSVMKYSREWETYVNRQGRWVSFENDYKTMDIDYTESVMWAFKRLYDMGLIYQTERVVPYSWAAETPVSNFETRMDNSYRSRVDPAVTAMFKLRDPSAIMPDGSTNDCFVLAWTTTPWTLPANLLLAIAKDAKFSIFERDDQRLLLSSNSVASYKKELESWQFLTEIDSNALQGAHYEPLFDYFADTERAFRVLIADFVEDGGGTGIVHIAPGFGVDDFEFCKAENVKIVVPVDGHGEYTAEVGELAGLNVIYQGNKRVMELLKERKRLFRREQYKHDYPHCWRTDEPLIYRAVSSWYIEVSKFAGRMSELNQQTTWIPAHVKDGIFGNWLANARDWNISRERFWGAPIPIWESDDPQYPRFDAYGSLDELERDFGVRPTSLHRPEIDLLTRPNPDDPTGKSTMRRVSSVLDCWFESGSMPFAQVHYPFENKDWFEGHFPGDFIVEYVSQTRGWFYTLTVLACLLFDKTAFTTCLCHGVVLDEDGEKLSKRKRNYPDPLEVFDTQGSDALRIYLLSSAVAAGGDMVMDKQGDGITRCMRAVILPIFSAYNFFALYANADGVRARISYGSSNTLDRYILAKLRELTTFVDGTLAKCEIPPAYAAVSSFIDVLNNWYIRRSRSRFWGVSGNGERVIDQEAFDCLYTILLSLSKVMAPLTPFLSEYVFQALRAGESVHLTDWPNLDEIEYDSELVEAMDFVREVCSAVGSVREQVAIRTRMPLQSVTIAHEKSNSLAPYIDLLKSEMNVKDVHLVQDFTQYGTTVLRVDPKLGKKLGSKLRELMQAQARGDWTKLENGGVLVAGVELIPEQFEFRIDLHSGINAAAVDAARGLVVVDTELTADLISEGLARDFVRTVQERRKQEGLNISDRIELVVGAPSDLAAAIEDHRDFVSRELLVKNLHVNILGKEEKLAKIEITASN